MEEIWKDVKGYEGRYQVSSFGEIKSMYREVIMPRGGVRIDKEKIMSKHTDKDGYYAVSLSKNSRGKTFKVHQLVAVAFLNHIPNGHAKIVDHIDNNKTNNRADNLQVTTSRVNSSKDKKNKTSKYTGVSWDKDYNKWRAQIHLNGYKKNLGRYNTEEEAHNAYQNKLKEVRLG